jgi:hypothetical protein
MKASRIAKIDQTQIMLDTRSVLRDGPAPVAGAAGPVWRFKIWCVYISWRACRRRYYNAYLGNVRKACPTDVGVDR